MGTLRTHYDNLKVARDAPDIVIRAAYKTLTQRFHPDKNPGDERAARVMAVINQSYEVLSDPQKRRDHDAWILREEAKLRSHESGGTTNISPQWETPQEPLGNESEISKFLRWPFKFLGGMFSAAPRLTVFVLIIGGLAFCDAITPKSLPSPGPKPYTATPVIQPIQPSPPAYIRSATAPDGAPWPIRADYVANYPIIANDGLSVVTVDNGQNDSDVFVKLVSLDGEQAFPVRQFFIPARAQFTLKDVSPGNYDMRYRDLVTGGLSRSEAFQVEQTPTENGVQYSDITMTLYKVQGGTFRTYNLAESEF